MANFKDPHTSLDDFHQRIRIALIFVSVCMALLFVRFFWLQVIKHHKYSTASESNRIAIITTPALRGLITDRNGVVLAGNISAFSLEITTAGIDRPLEEIVDELQKIVYISDKDKQQFLKTAKNSKSTEGIPIRNFLTDEEVAKFLAQRFRFPGVEAKGRYFRNYLYGELGSHLLGYVGKVSQKDRDQLAAEIDDSQDEFSSDELRAMRVKGIQHMGKIGIEQSYEKQLRGVTGFNEVEITAGGRVVRSLSSTASIPGNNLTLAVDIKLQYIIEQLYGNRRGAAVVIEPATGDILAFVSKPTFDPNAFVDGIDSDLWKKLNDSPEKPLFNRPLRGTYPPGSTYKPFMALAALETGKRTATQTIADPGFYKFGANVFRDDAKNGHGMVDMKLSIAASCDTYYYMLAHDMGVNAIHDFMKPFGFGQQSGIDIAGEVRGILPSTEWKKNYFKDPAKGKWIEGETISIGIGQGYNSFSILQLAQATSILANRGVVMKPHLVKLIEDPLTHEKTLTVPSESYKIPLKNENIDVITNAMIEVNRSGTASQVFNGTPYQVAGKTGTAQVFSLKSQTYNASAISEFKRDHALYIAFAPADKPKYAIALVVENGGFGASAAAPIVRQALDYLILGQWPSGVPQWKNAQ